MSKENLNESGFESETSGLTHQSSLYQLNFPALYWRSPKLSEAINQEMVFCFIDTKRFGKPPTTV